MSSGCLCTVSLGGVCQFEGGLGGKVTDSRTHLLKSPMYKYDGKTGNFDRVESICVEVERAHHQQVVIKPGCHGSHL